MCSFGLVVRRVGGFSYTPLAVICLVVRRVGSLSYTPCWNLAPFWNLSCRSSVRESLLHAPFLVICLGLVGSFSYTPPDKIALVVSRLWSFSNTPRSSNCLVVRRMGSHSYTPRVGICLVDRRVGGLSYTPRARSCLDKGWWGVSLYDGICVFLRSRRSAGGEFLLQAPCWNLSCRSSVGESILQPLF